MRTAWIERDLFVLYIALLVLLLGLILLWIVKRRQQSSGLPRGKMIYSDTQGWEPFEEALFDPQLKITGRPDYIIRQNDQIIPVEVKSSHPMTAPYDGHVYQLAAYCHLVESTFGVRPERGVINYPNCTFSIEYELGLEKSLITLIKEMRIQNHHRTVQRSHTSPARCRGCGYNTTCDQSLY